MASSPPPLPAPAPWFTADAHHRLGIAAATAILAACLLRGHLVLPTLLVASWDVFALTSVSLAWIVIVSRDPFETRRQAKLEDSSRTFLFVMVVGGAVASLVAVALLLTASKTMPKAQLSGHVALSVAAVVLSWVLIHTIFALRYAHHYYAGAKEKARDQVTGGLVFPEESNPDYLDFAYFAFVIGMTCQVSDVQITRRSLRRIALWHGLIAFVFNTAILALFVNIVASLV